MSDIAPLKERIIKLEKMIEFLSKQINGHDSYFRDIMAYISAEGAEKDQLREDIRANYPT